LPLNNIRKEAETNFTTLRLQSIFHIYLSSGFSNLPFCLSPFRNQYSVRKEKGEKGKNSICDPNENTSQSHNKNQQIYLNGSSGLINQCSMLLPLTFCKSYNPFFYLLDVMNIQVYLWFFGEKFPLCRREIHQCALTLNLNFHSTKSRNVREGK
jgi:hypothetical protein